jgi:hypothetical protein
MTKTTERVPFKLLVMPCCQHQLCWVNPRYPSYCPACGKMVYPDVRGCSLVVDDGATLTINTGEG